MLYILSGMENESKTTTQEQDAVKIAEWLNIEVDWVNDRPKILGLSGRWFLLEWLSSPEGEVAMMDKLQDNYFIRIRKVADSQNDFKESIHIGLASLDLKIMGERKEG